MLNFVAIVSADMSRSGGGVPEAILPYIERLEKQIEIELYCFREPELSPGLLVHKVKFHKATLGLPQGLKKSSPQIIHVHGLWSPFSAMALRWRKRTKGPTIISPHGMLDPWALAQSAHKKALMSALIEKTHLNGSACIHALNQSEAKSIRAAGFTAPIAIVPNGIDIPIAVSGPAPEWMDKPTLLFLGRLHEKKGISELIQAFAMASRKLPNWRLAIAGWDDGPNNFRQEAADTGADIVFPGSLFGDDKIQAYTHAAACILPSYSEGLPMTILEAWAFERPVFMTAACNLPEGFDADAAAEITTNPKAMAQILATKLSDPHWLATAGKNGKQLVLDRFTWDRIAQDWQDIYTWAIGASPRPHMVHDAI